MKVRSWWRSWRVWGEAILDCCAAPGGKTAILAERNPQARVVACDVSGRRLEQMKRLLAHPERNARITYEVADAAQMKYRNEFDLVLCDVPCSGTGTLARNPEIRHRLTAEGLPRQHQRQVEILTAAMRAVRTGGRVVYATCSLEPEENAAVVEECLSAAPQFERVPAEDQLERWGSPAEGALESLRKTAFENGYLRTLPGVHPCDGFFAAVLVSR